MNSPTLELWLGRLTTLALIAVLILIIVGSLLPFEFAGFRAGLKAFLREGKEEIVLSDLTPAFAKQVIERLLGFIPLGFLIHQKFTQHQWRYAKFVSIGFVALIALVVEFVQAMLSSRHSRGLDFILATAAGIVGISLSLPLYQVLNRSVSSTARRILPGFLCLGNYLVVCLGIIAVLPAGTDIEGWDCRYPLLIGNELTSDRPWQGQIRGLAIYPRALNAEETQRLSRIPMTAANTAPRNTAGAIALYSFNMESDGQISIVNHKGPPLAVLDETLEQEEKQDKEGGLYSREPRLIKSMMPVRTLCESILASQAFTIEAEIVSGDLTQEGPARIISNSVDSRSRNFTLGEQGGELIFRVRTPQNGSNGNKIQLETEENALAGGWHHVVASYAGGVAKFFIEGEEATTPVHYDEALFLGTTLSVSTVLISGFLLLGMGVLASAVFRHRSFPSALVLIFCSTSLAPIIVLLTVAIWFGRPLEPLFIGAIVLTPVLGFILCHRRQWFARN